MTVCIPTQDGVPYIQWINYVFGDCAYSTQEAVSLLLGYASILFWLNAQLPQVIENYKMGSADCLSLNFLSIWLAGDTANLIGALLTHQLPFQLYLGFYFVSIDICLLCQWVYYSKIKAKHHHDDYLIIPSSSTNEIVSNSKQQTDIFQHPAQAPLNIHASNIIIDELTPFSSSASPSKWYTLDASTEKKQASKFMAMLLFSTWFLVPNADLSTMSTSTSSVSSLSLSQYNIIWLGRLFAWTCTSLYLMSRIPQLLKNRRRQSVEGLSASLFVFAVCGNLTYASSILSHPGQTIDSLLEALPYLIGSAGTLIFDFSIFCQFLYYKKKDNMSLDNKINQQV
ncbi:PQ loop repeat-domain-containing protein [Mucor lusitanicus]|uniref:PQ loop repeat-domain-containing protein n=2 Tax=Mucor circinelloides f. lusitanicus TaxID=29924 RepID=A0A8H4BGA2_MUCCL|nr:PQ loop repeat-domain-containing protein [Mucor lusitanicus]